MMSLCVRVNVHHSQNDVAACKLLTVFSPQLIAIPGFCYSHSQSKCVCVHVMYIRIHCGVCVCFRIILYVNCFDRTVLYVCIGYHIKVNVYYVSAQGVDEHAITVP